MPQTNRFHSIRRPARFVFLTVQFILSVCTPLVTYLHSSQNLVSKYTCPSADVCKFDTNAPLLRGLGWLRGRSITKTDPYFSELVEEMVYSLEQEVDFDKDGQYGSLSDSLKKLANPQLLSRPCDDKHLHDFSPDHSTDDGKGPCGTSFVQGSRDR